ncbi:MAG TPA: hypothetical protein VFW02_10430, partial [Candidatus Limnocylindrales bacterium]|nr:hypothetical protein [Candidatus Limnocylindrales bacterium]
MATPPLRGRRGRDRRIAERVASDFAARHAAPEDAIDFDVAEVDAEVEDAARAARRAVAVPRPPRGSSGGGGQTAGRGGSGHRLPDLSVLPPLLAATGTFAALRDRLGAPVAAASASPGSGEPTRRVGRHV